MINTVFNATVIIGRLPNSTMTVDNIKKQQKKKKKKR